MSDGAVPKLEADVTVVGGGPAGIAAAACAAEAGRRVVVVDRGAEPGGQIWRQGVAAPKRTGLERAWIDRLGRSGAVFVPGAFVFHAERVAGGFRVCGERDDAPWRVTSNVVVLATGARELFLPFPGWTLPGVIGVGGAQALLKAGASFAGRRVVVAGTGPLLLAVAASLAGTGARVVSVVEQAGAAAVARFASSLWRRPAVLVQASRYRAALLGVPYHTGAWVASASGDGRVHEVAIVRGNGARRVECDILCTGFGLVPNTELAGLLGCAVEDDGVVVDDAQETSAANVFCAGESTGIGGAELSLLEGEVAGLSAAGVLSPPEALTRARERGRQFAGSLARAFALRDELRRLPSPETVVCRCEDVPMAAISPEWTARQAKLYTRAGMGACQGRICGAAMDFMWGRRNEPNAIRLPAEPVLFSTLHALERGGEGGGEGGVTSAREAR